MKISRLLKSRQGLSTLGLIVLILLVFLGTASFKKIHDNDSQWRVGNGWGICGGYGTKYLKEIPTDIYPALYAYFHVPTNLSNAFNLGSEATAVDPKKESETPHICSGPLIDIEGTDATYSKIATTASANKAVVDKTLTKLRKHYQGVVPAGASKALQILISQNVAWPNYSGQDPYLLNLQVDGNYLLTKQNDLVLGFYPKSGWRVVFEYPKSDAPFLGYPPTGS